MQSNSKTADLTRTRKGVREGYGYKAYQKTGKILPPAQGNARISLIIFRGAPVDSDNGFSENIFQYCLMNTWLCHEGGQSVNNLRFAVPGGKLRLQRHGRPTRNGACGAETVRPAALAAQGSPGNRCRAAGATAAVSRLARRDERDSKGLFAQGGAPGRPLRLPLERERELSRGVSGKPPRPNGRKRRCILADVTPCPRLLRREEYHPRCGLPPGTALRGLKD